MLVGKFNEVGKNWDDFQMDFFFDFSTLENEHTGIGCQQVFISCKQAWPVDASRYTNVINTIYIRKSKLCVNVNRGSFHLF
jgi:hypothetical protein